MLVGTHAGNDSQSLVLGNEHLPVGRSRSLHVNGIHPKQRAVVLVRESPFLALGVEVNHEIGCLAKTFRVL